MAVRFVPLPGAKNKAFWKTGMSLRYERQKSQMEQRE